jgi:hypothetical protein
LFQKINILNDKVCVAFAGSLFEIKKFYYDFKQYCKYFENIKEEHIRKFAEDHKLENNPDIAVMIMIADTIDSRLVLRQFIFGPWQSLELPMAGKVFAAGTGANLFIKELGNGNFIRPHDSSDYNYSLTFNMLHLSRLLTGEGVDLQSVENHFGAGFELVYWAGNKFEKLSNFSYTFLYSTPENPEKVIPSLIIHYEYDGDMLLMTCVMMYKSRLEETANEFVFRSERVDATRFVVTPIDFDSSTYVKDRYEKDFSFKSMRMAIGFYYMTDEGSYRPSIVGYEGMAQAIYHDSKSVELRLSKELFNTLLSSAKDGLSLAIQNRNTE